NFRALLREGGITPELFRCPPVSITGRISIYQKSAFAPRKALFRYSLGCRDLECLRSPRCYSALLWRSIMAKKSKKASQTGSREPNLLTIAYAARLEREVNREAPSPRAVGSRKKPRTPHK